MMAREPKRIIVAPGTELARLLDDAASSPVLLEKDGELYRLNRAEEEDVWASYDPPEGSGGSRQTRRQLEGYRPGSL